MMIYSEVKEELQQIKQIVANIVPLISEEKWHFYCTGSMEKVNTYLNEKKTCDLLVYDITKPDAIYQLEQLRRAYSDAFLLIIADTNISPMKYMKPSIKAASLLLRPILQEGIESVIREFLIDYVEQKDLKELDQAFKIETKGEVQYVSYNNIYYFEARKRKLYLRTVNEEYQFMDTVDHLEQILGSQFVRCHRSFIVNVRKIVSVTLSDNVINLTNELTVPLSRGFRSNVKNIMTMRKDV